MPAQSKLSDRLLPVSRLAGSILARILVVLFVATAGTLAAATPAHAKCGGDGQVPCKVEKVRSPCYGCWGSFCGGCYYTADQCDDDNFVGRDLQCHKPTSHISRPATVDFMDGTHRVTEGYYVKIDLRLADVVVPNLDYPATCSRIANFPNTLRTVAQDQNAPTVADWAESSYYRSSFAVNGSFFEVFGYYGNGDIHSEVCTHVYGYTVSDGKLIRREEQIKVYSKDHGPRDVDAGTLMIFKAGTRDARATMGWYPMFPRHPSMVPPDLEDAISGTQLLKNGVYVTDAVAAPDPTCRLARSAAGLTADGNTLIFVVVNPGKNGSCRDPAQATTLASLAAYLKSLGAENAISLDGGGSSQLYYTDNRGVVIRSLPSDRVGLPGFRPDKRYYRPVANFIGIR